MARLPLLLLSACLLVPASGEAQAQVRRCVDSAGRTVYTDHRCEDLGAVERVGSAVSSGSNSLDPGPRLYSRGCPRTLSALVGELGAAIQSGNVNRLSSIYYWAGTSNAAAKRILDQLEGIVARPLVDIAPVMPPEPDYYAGPSTAPVATTTAATTASDPEATPATAWMPSWRLHPASASDTGADAGAGPGTAAPAAPAAVAAPAPPPRPRPVGLRVEQTLANSATPSRTVFGLRRSYGCFWLAL